MSKQLDLSKVASLLEDSSRSLLKVASERDELKEKLAQSEEARAVLVRHMEAEKVAMEMHSKGIRTEVPLDTLTEHLEKEASAGRLEQYKLALDMTGPDMMKGAFIRDDGTVGAGASEFEQFITGGVG